MVPHNREGNPVPAKRSIREWITQSQESNTHLDLHGELNRKQSAQNNELTSRTHSKVCVWEHPIRPRTHMQTAPQ